ncbi:MAG: CDP-glycerol glycerophosphotransferase family protein [Bifidobacteriaceae bacterium]|jgi:hypothetical protein|nr:CDP-glycerol glycerophosphotransferase family protein [Bifidobacteriaceae bacterium]
MIRPSFLPDVPLSKIVWGLDLPLILLNGAALVTALAAWRQVSGPVLACMSAGVCLMTAGLGLRRAFSLPEPLLGSYVLARLTLVYAAFGWHRPEGGAGLVAADLAAAGPGAAWLLPGVLVAACLLAEPVGKAFAAQAFPYAAKFPGVKTRTRHLPASTVFWVNLAATALITTLGQRLTGLGVIVAAVTVLANVVLLADMAVFAIGRLRFNARLPHLWEDLRPTFVVHWQAPRGSTYQLHMWMDYLEALERPFFICTRTRENFAEVVREFDVPVLHRVGLENTEDVLSPSLKAVFYVNTAILNDHMLRYPHLNHIQLNHGDSDKIASYSPVFRAYDHDFVAGQAAIDRFHNAGLATAPGFFAIVGRPQVSVVRPARGPVGSLERPAVLYAPTWWGNTSDSNYSSLPRAGLVVQGLLDRGCTVIFRPHPYWERHWRTAAGRDAVFDLLAKDAAATGRAHIFGPSAESEMSIFDCFNLSDFMVSDVSSVVNDYLFSLKPLIMMAVTTGPEQFSQEFPVARGAYVVDYATLDGAGQAGGADEPAAADTLGRAGEMDGAGQAGGAEPPSRATQAGPYSLTAALDAVFGTDRLESVRRELETYYLGDIPREHYVERFLEEARKYV